MKVNFIIVVITVTFLSQTPEVGLVPDAIVINIIPKRTVDQDISDVKPPTPHQNPQLVTFLHLESLQITQHLRVILNVYPLPHNIWAAHSDSLVLVM